MRDFIRVIAHVEMTKLITFPITGFASPCQNKVIHERLSLGLFSGAVCAGAIMLNDRAPHVKPIGCASHMIARVTLLNARAVLADKKLCHMPFMSMIAGHIRIERFNAVHKAKA